MEFDQAIDGFGSAVVGAAGVEVAQERVAPLFQGASEAGDLGDRAAGEAGQDRFGQGPALGWCVGVIDGPEALGALPGDVDFVVTLIGGASASRFCCRSVRFSTPERRMLRIR